jgi:hypothetical protein
VKKLLLCVIHSHPQNENSSLQTFYGEDFAINMEKISASVYFNDRVRLGFGVQILQGVVPKRVARYGNP